VPDVTIKASVLSVNVGRAIELEHASIGRTGIDKRPVDHPVQVSAPGLKHVGGSGLGGDEICNLRHHGGNDQAVYAYAREDLDQWAAELGHPLSSGSFGENLTTIGIDLGATVVGEHWAIGESLLLEVSDPRIPCRTFAGFLGEQGWIKRFTERAQSGTYLRVLDPGPVSAGDQIRIVQRPQHGVTVATAFRAFTSEAHLLAQLVAVEALSAEAKDAVARRGPAASPAASLGR
jgi:MOSC domain-containing protein YiiM